MYQVSIFQSIGRMLQFLDSDVEQMVEEIVDRKLVEFEQKLVNK